jgi:hypothetical protein
MQTPEERKAMWAFWDAIRAKQPDLMTEKELLEALKQDKFTFNFFGHVDVKDAKWLAREIEIAKEALISGLEFHRDYHPEKIKEIEEGIAKGKPYGYTDNEGKFHPEDVQKGLEYHKQSIFHFENTKLKAGDSAAGSRDRNFHCFKCGEDFPLVLLSATEIGVGPNWKMQAARKTDCTCPFPKGMRPVTIRFNVPTGKLVFANFFDDRKTTDKKEDDCDCYASERDGKTTMEVFEPKDKWKSSINDFIGRVKLMKHYASKFNIAYGQMGNMSIGIYVNRTGDKIIIGCHCPEDCDEDRKMVKQWKRYKKQGFKMVGELSLEMWRWMACDKSILDQYQIPLKEEGDRYGVHTVEVKKGKWKMTHRYDSDLGSDDDFVYSVLEFVK